MAVMFKVSATTGTYIKDGQEKKRYADIGVVLETRAGPMLKLETIPVNWDGVAFLNDPNKRSDGKVAPTKQEAGLPSDDFADDDIPF